MHATSYRLPLLLCLSLLPLAGWSASPNVLRDVDRLSWTPRATVCAHLMDTLAELSVSAHLRAAPGTSQATTTQATAVRYLRAAGFLAQALPKTFTPEVLRTRALESAVLVDEALVRGQLSPDEVGHAVERCVTFAQDLYEQGHLSAEQYLQGDSQALEALRRRGPAVHPDKVQSTGSPSFAFKEQDPAAAAPAAAPSPRYAVTSGFIVAPGYLVTSLRGLQGLQRVQVVNTRDKTRVDAELVAQDEGLDAALLRAPVEGPALTLAQATPPEAASSATAERPPEPVAVGYALRAQLQLEPRAVPWLNAQELLAGAVVLNGRGEVLERLQAPRAMTTVPAQAAATAAPALATSSPAVSSSPERSAEPAAAALAGPASAEPVAQKTLRDFLLQALTPAGVSLKPGTAFEQTGLQEALRGAAPSVFLVVAQPR